MMYFTQNLELGQENASFPATNKSCLAMDTIRLSDIMIGFMAIFLCYDGSD